MVVDADDQVIGVASLSDLLTFLVLKPVGLERKEGIPHIRAIAEVLEESAEEAHHNHEKAGGSSAGNKTETTHVETSATEEETNFECKENKTDVTGLV